jgi:hypothetical protein
LRWLLETDKVHILMVSKLCAIFISISCEKWMSSSQSLRTDEAKQPMK